MKQVGGTVGLDVTYSLLVAVWSSLTLLFFW